jgi:hypothetical protein
MSKDEKREHPERELKDLDPAEEAEEVQGGRRTQPFPDVAPRPTSPPAGPVPIPYPNSG